MKVVLFCGGLGMRLREYSESIPKPMVNIGNRPILWQVMKYYAHFGHKDFILCLGWKGDVIKDYFLNYEECMSNDFVYRSGGQSIDLLNSDIHDWRITFADTGTNASIGQRLKTVEPYLEGNETFLANYTDGLTDLPLPRLIDFHHESDTVGTFVSVKPTQTFHAISATDDGCVNNIEAIEDLGLWMNGGYFVFNRDIFRFIRDNEELVEQPFRRLIRNSQLATYRYEGFWSCMDTYKEKQELDDRYLKGDTPWEVWKEESKGVVHRVTGAHDPSSRRVGHDSQMDGIPSSPTPAFQCRTAK